MRRETTIYYLGEMTSCTTCLVIVDDVAANKMIGDANNAYQNCKAGLPTIFPGGGNDSTRFAGRLSRDLRASFVKRMRRSTNSEWRDFWETEVLFLDGRSSDAVSRLYALAGSGDDEVAVAALTSRH